MCSMTGIFLPLSVQTYLMPTLMHQGLINRLKLGSKSTKLKFSALTKPSRKENKTRLPPPGGSLYKHNLNGEPQTVLFKWLESHRIEFNCNQLQPKIPNSLLSLRSMRILRITHDAAVHYLNFASHQTLQLDFETY